MNFHKNIITASVLAVIASAAHADQKQKNVQLDTISSTAHPLVQTAADFAVADHVIDQKNYLKDQQP